MLQGGAGGRVDTHSNNAANKNIAGESSGPCPGKLGLHDDNLLLVTRHVECDGKLILAVHLQGARRGALMTERGARSNARRLGNDLHLICSSARDSRASRERNAGNTDKKTERMKLYAYEKYNKAYSRGIGPNSQPQAA